MKSNFTPSFVSLKWKSALLLGLMILVLNTLFPILVYWNSQQKFDFSRHQTQQQFQQYFVGQLNNSSKQLQRMAELSLLPDNASINSINRLLQQHRSRLELDWQITQAQLFSRDKKKVAGWGAELPKQVLASVSSVVNLERPTTFVNCSQSCKQYDLIPVLRDGKIQSVLILAYDLSNSFIEFSNKTAADIAILSARHHNSDDKHIIPQWDMEVSALTSANINMPYLLSLAAQNPVSILEQSALIRLDNLPVEFNIIYPNSDVHFIIIDDISLQQHDIMQITTRSALIALFSVLILACGIFLFVSPQLRRLSKVSQALPLLSSRQYNKVRKLMTATKKSRTVDELDQLEMITHSLTSQLEALDREVVERSQALEGKSTELQQERDFVHSLIDTAPLIIITFDTNWKICSFNHYAQTITGQVEDTILNNSVKALFGQQQWPQMQTQLKKLFGSSNYLVKQHQSEIKDHLGSKHTISWLHRSIAGPGNSPLILSIGLDISEQKRHENEITWLAEHDVLTNLYNRRKFNLEFELMVEDAQKFKLHSSLLFLDLDQFKDINDSCGHQAGDTVLQQVAEILRNSVRQQDIIARLGGDEFAVLLPSVSSSQTIALAEYIIQQIQQMKITFNNVPYKLTTSLGIVQFPIEGLSIEELISNADLAMYEAKKQGKNNWYQFNLDSQARHQLEQRILWKHRISDALENNKFIFHYQPIMDIVTHDVSHYEVLIRMEAENGKIYPPDDFIDVAEKNGLINQIDHYVLKQAILKQAELDAMQSGISLSLNLSGYAVDDRQLLPLFKRLISESHADPKHLILELTETSAVADIDQAKILMQQLRELGCRFSLDDFGTGFASFHYLRELPMDLVKIDGAFISNIVNNPDDQLFVKALVDVAKGMGKKTIAEYVGDQQTLDLLADIGVDYAQGYYIGKPKPEFLSGPPELIPQLAGNG